MNVRTVVISLGVILGIIAAVIAIGHFYADIITPNSLVTIQGTVVDEKNNPVDGVLVTISEQNDRTDINGKYIIQNVPGGVKAIVAKKESHLYRGTISLKKSDKILSRDIIITSTIPTPTPTPSPTPTATSTPSKAGRWYSVITFTGSGDKETAPFTIRGDEWRVKWSVSSSSNSPFFYVYVYPWGRTGGSVSYWLCIKASFSATQYIDEGAGDYYFNIGAENRDSWKLEVEDYY